MILLVGLPHTGTTLVKQLIRQSPDISFDLPIGEIFSFPIRGLEIPHLFYKNNDFSYLIHEDFVDHIEKQAVGKITFYSAEDIHNKMVGVMLFGKYLEVKFVLPMRNPHSILESYLRRGKRFLVDRFRNEFPYLVKAFKSNDSFLIPVDLLAKMSQDDRCEYLFPLFEDFFGVDFEQHIQEFICRWEVVGRADSYLEIVDEDRDLIDKTLEEMGIEELLKEIGYEKDNYSDNST